MIQVAGNTTTQEVRSKMRAIRFTLKAIIGLVLIILSLAWMIFFGVWGVFLLASVFFGPVGIASFGLATMPLFAALAWMGVRRPAQQVVIVSSK